MRLCLPVHILPGCARDVISNFVEVYVDCSLETCRARDPKSLYKKATEGKISSMTGVQDVYEPPPSPEIIVNTERAAPAEAPTKFWSGYRN